MKVPFWHDQRGIGLLPVLIGLLVVIVVLAVGLQISQGDQTSSGTEAQQSQKASDCLKVYKDRDLCEFASRYDISKLSYKLVMTSTDANGTTTGTFLSDGKGNNSMADENEGLQTNFIFYNGIAYQKDENDGQWFKFARGDRNAPVDNNPTNDLKFEIATGKTETNFSYKRVSKEKCNELSCLKYQLIDSSLPGATQYFWFDNKDYRLQRYTSQDADIKINMEIEYLPVRLKAPSPTKEFVAPEAEANNE